MDTLPWNNTQRYSGMLFLNYFNHSVLHVDTRRSWPWSSTFNKNNDPSSKRRREARDEEEEDGANRWCLLLE